MQGIENYISNIIATTDTGKKRSRAVAFSNANTNAANGTITNLGKTRKRPRGLSSLFKSATQKLAPRSRVSVSPTISVESLLLKKLSEQREIFHSKGFLHEDERLLDQVVHRVQEIIDHAQTSSYALEETARMLTVHRDVLKLLVIIFMIDMAEKNTLPVFKDLLVSAGAKCTVLQLNDGAKRLAEIKLPNSSNTSGAWDSVLLDQLVGNPPTATMLTDPVFAVEYSLLTQFAILLANGYIQANKEWFEMNNVSHRPRDIPRENIYKRIRSGCGFPESMTREEVLEGILGQYYPAVHASMSMANFMEIPVAMSVASFMQQQPPSPKRGGRKTRRASDRRR